MRRTTRRTPGGRPLLRAKRGRAGWWRRLTVLGAVLAVAALVVPDSGVRASQSMLVKVDTATGVDHARDVVWILALGSDARVTMGQSPERSRADAIQLVGLNLRTGHGAVIGIPRDSWVPIDGYGSNRINSALYFGGPQLMADTVGDLVGVRPDFVFTTTFVGFKALVQGIGGVTVHSRLAFTDDNMIGDIHRGVNHLSGFEALFFGRARHFLPRGDFDRSANQQELLRAILRQVRARQDEPGFFERGVLSALENLSTDLGPVDLYRLARSVATVDPAHVKGCVVNGTFGTVNGASIVFPDTGQARRLGNEARDDGTFDGGC